MKILPGRAQTPLQDNATRSVKLQQKADTEHAFTFWDEHTDRMEGTSQATKCLVAEWEAELGKTKTKMEAQEEAARLQGYMKLQSLSPHSLHVITTYESKHHPTGVPFARSNFTKSVCMCLQC
jgi:hypothetical protein